MKHVFLVHSNTALITTLAVIRNKKISEKNVLFLLTRGFTTSLSFPKYEMNDLFSKFENLNYSNFYKGWNSIKKVDHKLLALINGDFTVYLPHVAHPFFQIIATNKFCTRVNIIEEGVNCLSNKIYDNKTSIKFQFISILFNHSGLYGKKRYFRVRSNIDFPLFKKSETALFYGITPKAFNHVKSYPKIILDYNFPELFGKNRGLMKNSRILVLEAIVEQGNLSKSTFEDSVKYIAEKTKGEKLFVKFHPAQIQENIDSIITLLEEKVELIILPPSTILEFEFLQGRNFTVYGFTSSLLHYANLFGHEVNSYASQWLNDKKFIQYRSYNDFPLLTKNEI